MFVTHLALADFRSYPAAEVDLRPGVTVFTGRNGQGKTNLVEAVEYLATLGSHRVASDAPLIRAGADRAIVRARVQAGLDDPRTLLVEIEINAGRANKAFLNRGPLQRPRDLLGALRVVLFSPDDLALVKGDPAERRRFVDELVTARWPRMAGVRADFDRVLRQRSTLLKSLDGRSRLTENDTFTLEFFSDQLATLGAEITRARLDTLGAMRPDIADAYGAIAPTNNVASVGYKSSSITGETNGVVTDADAWGAESLRARYLERMAERRREEIARGLSLVGPHRDDLVLGLGDFPAKGYASHGECWSLALALRLGSDALLRADGVDPVLVLDDVFAELDEVRRERLADRVRGAEQVLITAAVAGDVPASLAGRRFLVAGGAVAEEGVGDVVGDDSEVDDGEGSDGDAP